MSSPNNSLLMLSQFSILFKIDVTYSKRLKIYMYKCTRSMNLWYFTVFYGDKIWNWDKSFQTLTRWRINANEENHYLQLK